MSRREFSPPFRTHTFIPSSYQLAVVNPDIDEECNDLESGEVLCLGYPGEDCTQTYVVTNGDTCDGVAYTFGINTTILYTNNPQLDQECTNLYIGEVSFSVPYVLI